MTKAATNRDIFLTKAVLLWRDWEHKHFPQFLRRKAQFGSDQIWNTENIINFSFQLVWNTYLLFTQYSYDPVTWAWKL